MFLHVILHVESDFLKPVVKFEEFISTTNLSLSKAFNVIYSLVLLACLYQFTRISVSSISQIGRVKLIFKIEISEQSTSFVMYSNILDSITEEQYIGVYERGFHYVRMQTF